MKIKLEIELKVIKHYAFEIDAIEIESTKEIMVGGTSNYNKQFFKDKIIQYACDKFGIELIGNDNAEIESLEVKK